MVQSTYKRKTVIIGDSAVGKTSLISCFVEHKFPNDYLPTIGTNLYVKEITVSPKVQFQMTCWDIAGEKKWTTMRKLYYKGATGVFMVGDLTRKETFESLKKYWLVDMRQHCDNVPIILLANKDDLPSSIDDAYLHETAQALNAVATFRTSAKAEKNVNDAFMEIVKAMLSR
ncbi:MAG: GTP-binding protein [Candidatus Lokiarchaeota archaeon]|nr:GTP-binding protein [Candidatus Lokiarchaeota archaeon]